MPQMLTRNKEMFEYGLSINYVVISIAYFDAVSSVDWIILQLNMISMITIGRISKKKNVVYLLKINVAYIQIEIC